MLSYFLATIIIVAILWKGISMTKKQASLQNKTVESDTSEIKLQIEDFKGEPEYFGYKSWWLAIKANNNTEIASFIKSLEENAPHKLIFKYPNWSVSLTSPMNGWVFIIGEIPVGDSKESLADLKVILTHLSSQFGEVQFFATHRIVEYHCWAKALNGSILRIYSYLGESGENKCIEGEPSDFEKQYHLLNTFSEEAVEEGYYDREDLVFPDEEFVMKIAENWSLSPAKFTHEDWKSLWTEALVIKQKKM